MRRILYVTDSLMPGGIESQLTELVTRLDGVQYEPDVLCLYGPRARSLHFAPRIRAAGIELATLDLGWGAADKARAVTSIVQTAWRLRPHILQAEGYHANLLTRMARPVLPALKLVGTVRGVHTHKQLLYERLSYRLCARIVVNAPHLAKMLQTGAGVPPAMIEYIPNGVDIALFAAPVDRELRGRIAPGARRVCLSLGRIGREKNMHWTAAAFGLLKRQSRLPAGSRLFIVGPVESSTAQSQLDEAIAEDGLSQIVIQHPAARQVVDYYHASDVSIIFSPAEGLPNVCIESLAAGRPVIISEAANAAGVIEHGVTGWVVRTGDVAHLADTLSAVLTAPDQELMRMRASCVARAHEFDVAALVERYARLYQDVARG